MATIGILDVGIRAKTSDFDKGIGGALKTMKGFSSQIPIVGQSMSSLNSAFAAAGPLGLAVAGAMLSIKAASEAVSLVVDGVEGSIQRVKAAMASIDTIAKTADIIGLTTEQLIGLEHGAKLAGVGVEQLKTGFQHMEKTIGEAAVNGGAAEDALKQIGLTSQQLSKESPADAFRDIADAISKMPNAMERVAVAEAVFGKAGADLIPMLQDGSAGIDAMNEDADKLGLTLSRFDAAGVEQANDAFTRMGEQVDGVFQSIAVAVAPAMTYLVDEMIKAGTAIREWWSSHIPVTFSEAFRFILQVAEASFDFIMQQVDLVRAAFDLLAAPILKIGAVFAQTAASIGSEAIKLAETLNKMSPVDVIPQSAINMAKDLQSTIQDIATGSNSLGDFFEKDLGDALAGVAEHSGEMFKNSWATSFDEFLSDFESKQQDAADRNSEYAANAMGIATDRVAKEQTAKAEREQRPDKVHAALKASLPNHGGGAFEAINIRRMMTGGVVAGGDKKQEVYAPELLKALQMIYGKLGTLAVTA